MWRSLNRWLKNGRGCGPSDGLTGTYSYADHNFRIADHPPRTSFFASQNAACRPRQTHVRNAGLLETDRLAAEMLNRLRQEDYYGDDFPGRRTRIKRRSLPHLASLALQLRCSTPPFYGRRSVD